MKAKEHREKEGITDGNFWDGNEIDFNMIYEFAEEYHKAEVEDKISKLTNKHYNRLRNSQGDAECRRLLKEQLLKR